MLPQFVSRPRQRLRERLLRARGGSPPQRQTSRSGKPARPETAAGQQDLHGRGGGGMARRRDVQLGGNQGAQSRVVRVNLPTLLEPGNQGLVIDPVQRGEARTTQTAGLVGFDKRLHLLRSVAQAPAPVGLQNHFIHIRHSGRIHDGYDGWRANSHERCFGPRLRDNKSLVKSGTQAVF